MVNCDYDCLYYKDGACSRDIAQHNEYGDCVDRKERSAKILISGEGYKTRQLLRNLLNSETEF